MMIIRLLIKNTLIVHHEEDEDNSVDTSQLGDMTPSNLARFMNTQVQDEVKTRSGMKKNICHSILLFLVNRVGLLYTKC